MDEEIVKNFITEFHNLEGVTVAEKKRNLFQLFNKYSQSFNQNQSLLNTVTSQLTAQTHLEGLFLVKFLIHHRQFDELYKEYLKGDETIVSKIAKENWFFQQAFNEIGAEFVTETLPSLSYRLRLKILKKMSLHLNEQQADEIFDALLKRYGLFTAANVLTCCSVEKIEHILKNYALKLSINQLKRLYNKNPTLIYTYLEEREKHEGNAKFMDSDPFFEYVAQKNLDMYCDLQKKYNFNVKLGKRTTEKLIAAKRSEIIDNPELYVKNLNPACLVKKLGPDFKQVFIKLFPKKIEDSPKAQSSRLLKFFPKNGRYNLLVTTYNQIFRKKLDECPHLIDDYLLKMIVDGNERERMMKIKAGNDDSSYNLKYYRTDHCFEEIKEKLKFERSPYERGRLVGDLVRCCIINDDYDALFEVSKFVSERFKNDNRDVLTNFIDVLIYDNCKYQKLTEHHWNEIRKILASLNHKMGFFLNHKIVFLKYVEFLVKTDRPLTDEIVHFFKENPFVVNDIQHIDGTAQKPFLNYLIESAPKLLSASNTAETVCCQLILACKKYNHNCKNVIQVWKYPTLIQSLKSIITKKISIEAETLSSALETIVCTTKNRNEEIEELTELYLRNFAKLGTKTAVNWFLKHKPERIVQHFEAFFYFCTSNTVVNRDRKVWHLIKNYSHLGVDRNAIEYCISKINDRNYKSPQFMARSLSLLMPSQEYLQLVEFYKPSSFRVDQENEEMSRKFQIQKHFLKGLVNINEPLMTLPLILEYCKDDYVPSCLSPLFSCFYKTPESNIKSFIDEFIENGTVSIKKHAFSLTCILCDEDTILNVLRSCQLIQSVAMAFKYFLKNQSQEAWIVFKEKVSYFDTNDDATLHLLVKTQIPKKFRNQHFETIWEIIDLRRNNKYKKILLQNVQNKLVLDLQPGLLIKIINMELFTMEEMDKIVSIYVFEYKALERFDVLFSVLEKHKSSSQFSIKNVYNFIFTLFTIYVERENTNVEDIESFSRRFQEIFRPTEAFEENIILSVMRLKNQSVHDFSKSVIILHNSLIRNYGETIVNMFAMSLKKLLPHFFKDNLQLYEFYYLLLKHKQSVEDMLLVIKLLPIDAEPEDKESFIYYDHTLSQLQEANLDCVQLHLNLHFKFHKVSANYNFYRNSYNSFALFSSSWLEHGAYCRAEYTVC